MSKKLIAVASAAALALTALVGLAPANAATFAVAVTQNVAGTGESESAALTVSVPTEDVMRADSAIKFVVTATTSTGAVTVASTGSVKLLTSTQYADATTTSATGAGTLSVAAAAGSATVYAYTTSTTNGTVTISNGGNTAVYNVKGIAGDAYTLKLTGDTTASKSIAFKLTATVTDMFGNPVTGLVISDFAETGFGAFASPTLAGFSGSKGVYKMSVTPGASGAGLLNIDISGVTASEIDAFGDVTDNVTLSVNSQDPTAQIAALTASVAALTADYNALAVKFNKKVKKAKNKVALK